MGGRRIIPMYSHYFASIYHGSCEFWLTVMNYLEEHYDLEITERILISGEGTSLEKGLEK